MTVNQMKTKSNYCKYIKVDLTNNKIEDFFIDEDKINKFLMGRGIGDWLLSTNIDLGKVKPFDLENVIVFNSGILVGTDFIGALRNTVVSLNALTGGYGESSSGGNFSIMLKKAGYDGIIITGRSDKWVYLWINNNKIEIKDAKYLINKTTFETNDLIKRELGHNDISVCSIGPAGEKLVRFSLINCDNRYCARTGIGAVMGSKNLKAIAIRGTYEVSIFDPIKFKKILVEVKDVLRKDPSTINRAKYGLGKDIELFNSMGMLPVKNFKSSFYKDVSKIGYEALKKYYKKIKICPTNCLLRCDRFFRISKGDLFGGTEITSLEATPAYNMAHFFIDDIRIVLKAFELCNAFGIDMHSWSNVMQWAIECYEKGIISKKDTDNLELRWQDGFLLLESIKRIALREGDFFKLLGEGVYIASKEIGRGSEKYAIHIKGMELDDELRVDIGWALGILTESRGPGHTLSAYDGGFDKSMSLQDAKRLYGTENASFLKGGCYEDKAKIVVMMEQYAAIQDCLGLCFFTTFRGGGPKIIEKYNMKTYADLIYATTGLLFSEDELINIAERIITLERSINVLYGLNRFTDMPPDRFYEPIPDGPSKGKKLDKEKIMNQLKIHSILHGWDIEKGVPTKDTLKKLGLEYIRKQMGTRINLC